MTISTKTLSCYEFASNFDNATGTNFDPENPLFNHADNLDAKSRNCPIFANWGCFTANNTEGDIGNSFNKGCSMFERSDDSTECFDHELFGKSCKRQTSTSLGNPGGMEPLKELQKCYVCTESFDHAGNRIDNGPGNCINLVGDEHLEECDSIDDSCETAMYTDWSVDGSQVFQFIRKCYQFGSIVSDGETNCFEGKISHFNIQYKDCHNICTENGCNNNSDVVNANSKLDENGDPIKIR